MPKIIKRRLIRAPPKKKKEKGKKKVEKTKKGKYCDV